jgi:two-component system response regulator QseB
MHLLLTEDDPQVLASFRRMFERRGHRVDTASTGKDALAAIQKTTYELLVLDWGLPDIEGVEIVLKLRAAGRTLPILMLTGRMGDEDLVRALDAGADDFVPKGHAAPDVILARSEALVRRAQYAPPPRRIQVGRVVVDESTKSLEVAGESVDLTHSELKVFAILATNVGRLVKRPELVSAGWGEGARINDTALESLIKRLRRKLGPEAAMIQSVRLTGYVLVVDSTIAPDD